MTDLVEKALSLAAAKESAFPSASVDRPLDSGIDLGNLLAWDENDLDAAKLASDEADREDYLLKAARDSAQVRQCFVHASSLSSQGSATFKWYLHGTTDF
jgi:hypothetical protein